MFVKNALRRLVGLLPSRRAHLAQVEHLDSIERRLAHLEMKVNHWDASVAGLNHRLDDLLTKLGDAAADVETIAAFAIAMERTAARAGGRETPPATT